MSKYLQTPKCCVCGRFCKVADSGVPFGSYGDLEPPEDDLFCNRCAELEYDRCVRYGRVIGGYWIKPNWERRAAKELGYVLAGPKGAAWAVWCFPNRLPPDYEILENNC